MSDGGAHGVGLRLGRPQARHPPLPRSGQRRVGGVPHPLRQLPAPDQTHRGGAHHQDPLPHVPPGGRRRGPGQGLPARTVNPKSQTLNR